MSTRPFRCRRCRNLRAHGASRCDDSRRPSGGGRQRLVLRVPTRGRVIGNAVGTPVGEAQGRAGLARTGRQFHAQERQDVLRLSPASGRGRGSILIRTAWTARPKARGLRAVQPGGSRLRLTMDRPASRGLRGHDRRQASRDNDLVDKRLTGKKLTNVRGKTERNLSATAEDDARESARLHRR